MDNITLRRVQLTQLEILKEFRTVCDKHGIKYVLSSGTLLGAIRHNGFIPWDDDIDVDMPRADYNKFLKHAHELNENLYVQHWKNDTEFALPFTKIRMKGTMYIEENSQNMLNNGIYIDVFPCDTFSSTYRIINKFRFAILNYIRLSLIIKSPAYKRARGKMNRRKLIFARIVYLIPRKFLIALYESLACSKLFSCRHFQYFENGGASRIGSWVIKPECFEETSLHQFEDDLFRIPQNFDLYLSSVYGDYMQLPPENKRANRHGIIKVEFQEDKQ